MLMLPSFAAPPAIWRQSIKHATNFLPTRLFPRLLNSRFHSRPRRSITSTACTPLPVATELRTHSCGQLGSSHIGHTVRLHGWAHAVRDKGALIFLLLRDRHGIVQVTISENSPPEVVRAAKAVRLEYVVDVQGVVEGRSAGAVNNAMSTGQIEVHATRLHIVSPTNPLPFMIDENRKSPSSDHSISPSSSLPDETRLKYRFLDLRRPSLQANFILRHKAAMASRIFLDASGFIEVETPILTKATPEGARDYLVPSRVRPGSWYALPQSPQIYKQLLMVSGFDRYFQIARCFRDEDLRQDRQPEFTQIDLEMAFVERNSVMQVAEGIIKTMFSKLLKKSLNDIPRITYEDAMLRFGVDAPDLRFGMELHDITSLSIIQHSSFPPIAAARDNNGIVKAFTVAGAAKSSSRKILDSYVAFVKNYGLSGLLYGKVDQQGVVTGPLSKLSTESTDIYQLVSSELGAHHGDLILVATGKASAVNAGLGKLRVKIAHDRGLVQKGAEHAFCWVVDFPLFEYDEEAGRYTSVHHPFTSPLKEQLHLLDDESKLGDIKSDAYDLVCNGSELGGGSIRIHDVDIQQKVFRVLGISEDEQKDKFGFLLEALSYGAPPHGGLAFGLDRCIMMLSGAESIRDVVAFPKTTSASDLMAGAPAPVPDSQLQEFDL